MKRNRFPSEVRISPHNPPFSRRRRGDVQFPFSRRPCGDAVVTLAACVLALLTCAAPAPAKAPATRPAPGAEGEVITLPRLRLVVDRAEAARYGLSVRDIAAQLYRRIRTSPSEVSPADLARTLLNTKFGKLVRLSEVASIELAARPPDQPPAPGDRKGKIKSPTLTRAFAQLWPAMAAARSKAAGKPLPQKLTDEMLKHLTDVTDAFWVTEARERSFRAGAFDDKHNAAKLAAIIKELTEHKAKIPVALKFLHDECRAKRLKGAQLAIAVRLITDFLMYHRRRAKALSAGTAGSKLAFRVAPQPKGSSFKPTVAKKTIDEYRKDLAKRGPGADRRTGKYAWFEIKGPADDFDGLIVAEYQKRKYVLLCTGEGQVMLPKTDGRGAWALEKVYVTTDHRSKPAVGFRFDELGGRLFASLTAANKGSRLAVLVDGVVHSAPLIRATIRDRGIIEGIFTHKEAQELVWALRKGMQRPKKKGPDG